MTRIVVYGADILSDSSDSLTISESRSICNEYWSVQNGSVYRLDRHSRERDSADFVHILRSILLLTIAT